MNLTILHENIQQFIANNLKTDLTKLILKGSPFDTVSIQELAVQIASKKKSEKKLPSWFTTQNIYYPPTLNIEQTSSEITAQYKANLVSGKSLIDITGGFGVDACAFSKHFKHITHCEIDSYLSAIAKHNYQQLGITNITTIADNGISYLKNNLQRYNCIYIDPSRRDEHKSKVFLLKDCVPNIPEQLELLFSKTNTILVKNSPILDISSTIKELQFVKEIHIVAVDNEVKELLFLLEKEYDKSIKITTVNFHKNTTQKFQFNWNIAATSNYSEALSYLYEPNVAILKSGGFHQVSEQFKLFKLQQHSHLYTSTNLIAFPGRIFNISQVIPYDKKLLKNLITSGKANITTRNFPETVSQIRKKTKLRRGATIFVFYNRLT